MLCLIVRLGLVLVVVEQLVVVKLLAIGSFVDHSPFVVVELRLELVVVVNNHN